MRSTVGIPAVYGGEDVKNDVFKNDIKILNGSWRKSALDEVPKNGLKVLSTFSCGGGSSYGYKLAGFEVLGCVEIDPKMFEAYKKNHKFKYGFNMPIQDFNKLPKDEIPEELFELDVLDGSPPCSTFSMSGDREKKWGGEFHFTEGQAKQKLDELFFDFIDTAKMLQPKVVVAENVKGLIAGNAKGYVKQIFQKFTDAGYTTQLFLLNSSNMGVPQFRERVFFIANKMAKKINLEFNEPHIDCQTALKNCSLKGSRGLTKVVYKYWKQCKPGFSLSSVHPKKHYFGHYKLVATKPSPTITTHAKEVYHWSEPRSMSDSEIIRLQTFPDDYEADKIDFICGMSVPPFMMQRLANQIAIQLF